MISFPFKINKSFLEKLNHPITIPRENNERLVKEIYGGDGNRTITVRITPPEGRSLNGEIYYGISGFGPYYQIKILGNYPGYYLGDLQIGDIVFVRITRVADKVDVKIFTSAELKKTMNNFIGQTIKVIKRPSNMNR